MDMNKNKEFRSVSQYNSQKGSRNSSASKKNFNLYLNKKIKSIFKFEDKIIPPVQNKNLELLDDLSDFNLESINNTSVFSCQKREPIIIGICGGRSSGKSFISKKIKKELEELKINISIINEKNFLKINKQDDINIKENNFDDPNFINWDYFEKTIKNLSERKEVEIKGLNSISKIEESDLIIINGRIFYNNEYIREMCSVKIFLQTDLDLLLSRHIFKKMQKGFILNNVIDNYLEIVKPSYEKWIIPTKEFADLVISNFGRDIGGRIFKHSIKENFNIINILQDFLKFRLCDENYQTKLLDEKMSLLGKKLI